MSHQAEQEQILDKEMDWKKCFDLGRSKQQQGQHEEAMQCYNEALAIAQRNKCTQEEVRTFAQLGYLSLDMAKYPQAEVFAMFSLAKRNISLETTDKHLEFKLIMCIELAKAYKNLQNCAEGMKSEKKEVEQNIAQLYESLGDECMTQCEYENSITYYNKAIDLYQQLQDEGRLAKCYREISFTHMECGNYHNALHFAHMSLKLCEKCGDKESHANSLVHIGIILLKLEKNKEAIAYYKQGLTIAKQIKDKSLEGVCYGNIGWALICSGDYQEAIPVIMEGLKIFNQLGHKKNQAISHANIASGYVGMKTYQDALLHLEQSLAIAKELDLKDVEAWVCQNMAEVHYANQEFQQAMDSLEKCSEIASSIDNKDRFWKACHRLGEICRSIAKQCQDQEDLESRCMTKSKENLTKALDCYDYLSKNLRDGYDEYKMSIFDRFIQTYKLLTSVLIETQQTEHALLVSDRGRARVLGDRLVTAYGMSQDKDESSKPLSYPDVEKVLSNDVFTLLHYSSLEEGIAVWVSSKDSMALKEADKEVLGLALDSLFETRTKEHDDTVNRFLADTVAKAFEDMKIKEGRSCENRSLDDIIISEVKQNDGSTEPETRDDTGNDIPDPDLHSLEVLYNTLIAPILSDIQHDEIVIVPDGKMYNVPFAALRDPNTRKYLSESKRIRLVPSIAVLKLLQDCPADRHNHQGALIVGNPSVGKVKLRGKDQVIKDLGYAGIEVNCIKKLLEKQAQPKPNIKILTDKQATKDAVLAEMKKKVVIIHIAAHGSPNTGEIALAPIPNPNREGIPEEQDYLLTMKEVQEANVKAQLVVLSCCHSGQGEIRAEGMVGLGRAFLVAGARAVVASLWAISDEVTRNFMERFYECLLQGKRAGASLHEAMGHVRRIYSEPKFWAPFFLIGDDVTIHFGQ